MPVWLWQWDFTYPVHLEQSVLWVLTQAKPHPQSLANQCFWVHLYLPFPDVMLPWMCLYHVQFPPRLYISSIIIPNRLNTLISSTGWHVPVQYITSAEDYETINLVGCVSRKATECSKKLYIEKSHGIFGLHLWSINVIHELWWRLKLHCTYGYTAILSRRKQAWAVRTWANMYHVVCGQSTINRWFLLLQILPLSQFHSSHIIWYGWVVLHITKACSEISKNNITSSNRKLQSSDCQKNERYSGKISIRTSLWS